MTTLLFYNLLHCHSWFGVIVVVLHVDHDHPGIMSGHGLEGVTNLFNVSHASLEKLKISFK